MKRDMFMNYAISQAIRSRKGVVYEIVNTITGYRYIGSTTNFKQRKKSHLQNLKSEIFLSSRMRSDYNEHGIESFAFNIVSRHKNWWAAHIVERKLISNEPKIYNKLIYKKAS